MKETGLLMKGPMVRAILDGTKTMTRRVIKPQPPVGAVWDEGAKLFALPGSSLGVMRNCPYGQAGDLLYVRETYVLENTVEYHEENLKPTDRPYELCGDDYEGHYFLIPHYRATEPEPHIVPFDSEDFDDRTRWKPSIFMPKRYARIWLEITGVGVEYSQDTNLWNWLLTFKRLTP